jgi:hypothetical protein
VRQPRCPARQSPSARPRRRLPGAGDHEQQILDLVCGEAAPCLGGGVFVVRERQLPAAGRVQQVSVGLDLNLPVGTSLARAKCDLANDSASTTAFWLTAAGWVLQMGVRSAVHRRLHQRRTQDMIHMPSQHRSDHRLRTPQRLKPRQGRGGLGGEGHDPALYKNFIPFCPIHYVMQVSALEMVAGRMATGHRPRMVAILTMATIRGLPVAGCRRPRRGSGSGQERPGELAAGERHTGDLPAEHHGAGIGTGVGAFPYWDSRMDKSVALTVPSRLRSA